MTGKMNMKHITKLLILSLFLFVLIQSAFAENNLFVTSKYSKKQVCPCTTSLYEFDISNIGSKTEVYKLTVDKELAKYTTFSENNIILSPGEHTKIYGFITPECSFYGNYNFNFYVKTSTTKLKAKIPVELNIDACYDYKVTLEDYTGAYSVCDNQITTIPITIENNADFINAYQLDLCSPKYANLDYNKVQIPSDKEANINIVIDAPIYIEESSEFKLDVLSTRGNIKQTKKFDVNIENCYIPRLQNTKIIVGYNKTTTDFIITNTGSKKASYLLVLDAPKWVSLDTSSIELEPGKSTALKLITRPEENTRKTTYESELTVVVNENNAQYKQEFEIKLTKPCFIVKSLSAVKNNIKSILIYSLFFLIAIVLASLAYIAIDKIKHMERKPKEKPILKPIIIKEIKKTEKIVEEKKKKKRIEFGLPEFKFTKLKINALTRGIKSCIEDL